MGLRRHQGLSRRFLLTLGLVAFAAVAAGAENSLRRHPVPDADALAKTERLVREIYGPQFKAAKTSAAKRALTRQMLAQAGKSRDEPAAQYYLLYVARNIAVEAGEIGAALEAAERMSAAFDVDALELKASVVNGVAKTARSTAARSALAAAALALVDEALAADDLKAAGQLAQAAVTASRASRDRDLRRRAADCDSQMKKIARMHAEHKKALEVLDTKPADPKANLTAGRFVCLIQGRWEEGMPMLALGGDTALAATALKDLRRPVLPEDEVALADRWWKLAEDAQGREKARLKLRAGSWYKLARPATPPGLARLHIDKRLQQAAATGRPIPDIDLAIPKPGGPRPKDAWADALRGVDPDWDRVKGDWKRDGDAIRVEPDEQARALLPVLVEGGYDLEVEFSRTEGTGDVQVFLPAGSRTCHLFLSAYDGHVHVLATIDGKLAKDNLTARRPGKLVNGERYTVLASVRPQRDSVRIQIALDGEPLVDWAGKQSALGIHGQWYWPAPAQPGLGAHQSAVTFHAARLRTVSGKMLLLDTGGTRAKRYARTDCHGGDWGVPFHDLGPPGSLLVGFHFAPHHSEHLATPVLDGMRPVYRTDKGLVPGQPYEGEGKLLPPVLAKDGYAVGGVVLKAGAHVDGMRLIFMRVQGDRLDPNDTYQSDWFGGRGGTEETKIGGTGARVVGIYGNKHKGHASLGLILDQPGGQQKQ